MSKAKWMRRVLGAPTAREVRMNILGDVLLSEAERGTPPEVVLAITERYVQYVLMGPLNSGTLVPQLAPDAPLADRLYAGSTLRKWARQHTWWQASCDGCRSLWRARTRDDVERQSSDHIHIADGNTISFTEVLVGDDGELLDVPDITNETIARWGRGQ